MRAAAGLDAADPLGRQRAAPGQELGVLAGIDVVGDRDQLEAAAHALAQPVHQRRLARADRAADADAQRFRLPAVMSGTASIYWVSCAIEARSAAKVAPPKSAGSRLQRRGRRRGDDRLQRRQDALPVGLADDSEPQPGRNQIGGKGLQIADQRVGERDPGARRDRAEDGGVAASRRRRALTASPACGGRVTSLSPLAGRGLG